MPKFWKIGHRGAAGYEPENTIRSFDKAISLGADAIELDIRKCKSGEIVVMHDARVDRTTNGRGRVDGLTLSELRRLDAGSGERVPTLGDVFSRYIKVPVSFNLELKDDVSAEETLNCIWNHHLTARVIVSAFDGNENAFGDLSNWVDLLWMKRKEPNLKIALLVAKLQNAVRAFNAAAAFDVYSINVSRDIATAKPHFIGAVHNATPSLAMVWTVNDPTEISKLKMLGVDGIFSDYPDRL